MKMLNQERAAFALEKVLEHKEHKNKEKIATFSAGAPSMILKNGFGHTLAFWKAKAKEEHNVLFEIVRGWLDQRNILNSHNSESFFQTLNHVDQNQYLMAQKETLALLEWVKRYANAFLKKGE